jgi:sulfide:quinone oxidoreductase
MKRILILGAGTGGTMMANKLVRALGGDGWRVTVVDRGDTHVYQPGLLFVPFGQYRPEEIVKPHNRLLDPAVELRLGEIDRIAPDERVVYLTGGEKLPYEVLIVATGSRIVPESDAGPHRTRLGRDGV